MVLLLAPCARLQPVAQQPRAVLQRLRQRVRIRHVERLLRAEFHLARDVAHRDQPLEDQAIGTVRRRAAFVAEIGTTPSGLQPCEGK